MELKQIIASAWEKPRQELLRRLQSAMQQAEGLLELERQRTTAHQSSNLQNALGSLAGQSLDLSAVSRVLERKSARRGMDSDTLARVEHLHKELLEWTSNAERKIPGTITVSLGDAKDIQKKAVHHLNTMAQVFSLIRRAWLERNSKYEPSVHDAFFAEFTWEQLGNDEVALCPPFVVTAVDSGDRNFLLQYVLPLVTSGLPIKVLLEKNHFQHPHQGLHRSTALRCSLEIEMLPVALKGVFVLQDTVDRTEAVQHLRNGLSSPRPAIFSIFNDTDGERCHRAVQSRALPVFRYDPDQSEVFLKRFDLEGNPDLDQVWAQASVEYIDSLGHKNFLEGSWTFADFAATESAYQNDFSPVPEGQDNKTMPIADYLETDPAGRNGRLPFVWTRTSTNTLVKKIPSLKVVAQSDDRRHLWKSLCEMAGVQNPFLRELEQQIRTQAEQEKAKALAEQKIQLTAQFDQDKTEALQKAMRNLAKRLSGITPEMAEEIVSPVSVRQNAVPTPAQAPSAVTPVKSAASVASVVTVSGDEPWIDTKSCSGCDECVTIDPNIFAYNADKQAYIKNPKGGPYKNLVKAAKRCSAQIIHPGKER